MLIYLSISACIEPRPSVLNITLPAFAAQRRCLQQISTDTRYAASAQQQTSRASLLLSIDGTDRQTDGRTPDRFIVPAPHTARAASITDTVSSSQLNFSKIRYTTFVRAQIYSIRSKYSDFFRSVRIGVCSVFSELTI